MWQELPSWFFVEQICSPLPFLASEVLVRSVDQRRCSIQPIISFLGVGYDRLLEKIALRGE